MLVANDKQGVYPGAARVFDDLLRPGCRLAVAGAEQGVKPTQRLAARRLAFCRNHGVGVAVQLLGAQRFGIYRDALRPERTS